MGACVFALAVVTSGRAGRASSARAAALIERADTVVAEPAARAA